MSVRNNKNPFGDEDEYNCKFGKRPATTNLNSNNNNNNNFRKPAWGNLNNNNDDDSLEQIQQKIGKTENDSLESTQRALLLLNETHEIGEGAAQVSLFYVFIKLFKLKLFRSFYFTF